VVCGGGWLWRREDLSSLIGLLHTVAGTYHKSSGTIRGGAGSISDCGVSHYGLG
jgi:hypothetical protein